MRLIAAVLLMLISFFAYADADYVREKKWADEITPGIVVGDAVYLEQKNGHKFLTLFTQVKDAQKALIVIHGLGIHPDWGMVGTLRTQLADLGFTTLSVQMPVLASEAGMDQYDATYPEATERIAVAVHFLKAKGYQKIAIVSHSLGSDMARGYIQKNQSKLFAWASLGTFGAATYAGIKIPVLDLYGENDMPPVLKSAAARAASLKGNVAAKQVQVPKSDHFYDNHEAEMVKAVKAFLDSLH